MVVGPSWPPWPNCLGMLSGAGHKMGKAIRLAGSILVDIGPTPGPAVGTEGPPGTTYLYQSVAGTLTQWCALLRRASAQSREGPRIAGQERGTASDDAGSLLTAMAEDPMFLRRKSLLV